MLDSQTLITGGGLIAIFGLIYRINRDGEIKRSNIYEKIETIRGQADETYARQDICKVTHQQVSDDLKEIKTDVKDIAKELKRLNGGS